MRLTLVSNHTLRLVPARLITRVHQRRPATFRLLLGIEIMTLASVEKRVQVFCQYLIKADHLWLNIVAPPGPRGGTPYPGDPNMTYLMFSRVPSYKGYRWFYHLQVIKSGSSGNKVLFTRGTLNPPSVFKCDCMLQGTVVLTTLSNLASASFIKRQVLPHYVLFHIRRLLIGTASQGGMCGIWVLELGYVCFFRHKRCLFLNSEQHIRLFHPCCQLDCLCSIHSATDSC